jgi:hypothetical protein
MPEPIMPELPDPVDLLIGDSMPVPDWLTGYTPGEPFPRVDFLTSRTVYYPGSATDGHPLILFGKSHAAHCFVFVDYGYQNPGQL